ncbi:uncharacterized protein LOC132619859 [Lycium barbarum]|uniref:uncharacterized protein LOC132619859 n=1 Tax=Lycium barbarum TaxID=112863 RepID=UPI00293E2E17|nr:uncharacterized protein LOC132619859 [Lycium barbarum]
MQIQMISKELIVAGFTMEESTQALILKDISDEEVHSSNCNLQLVGYYPQRVADAEQRNLALAIIHDIRDMQPLNVAVRVSPNKALHDVISHKLQEEHDAEGDAIDMKLQQVCVEAGLSPKSQSKGPKKGRKQNSEVPQTRQIQNYRRKLRMPYANSNCNGKIWFFVQDNVDVEVLLDTEQYITVKLQFQDFNKEMVVTIVYAKCSEVERMQLWDILYLLASNMTAPWLVGGDFNVILNEEEKIGGLPVLPQEYEDFAFCLNSCELHEMPFKGIPFTWWNGRVANDCIFKRLDRIVHNDTFQNWFGHLEVEHLSRTGSDHAPLLVSCGDQVEQDTFLDFVKQQWETALTDDVFLSFKLKMKKLKTALSIWSKNTFGDIFKQLVIREEIVKIKEQLFEENPSEENRMVMQRAQAELKLYLHYEEEFWRQKARMYCFSEGDKNTRYLHSLVKGRIKRIQIKRIKDDAGNWIEDVQSVAAQAVNFFHKQFTYEGVSEDSTIFNHIQELISGEDNKLLAEQPTMEEVKKAVFELNGDSACGPDGFSGIYYQKCWEVVKDDVYCVVKAFFEGQTLPKSITHTNLVLLPKKNVVEAFSDMRPISLSNFINKVISRVVHDRLDKLLTKVISPNQSGFVKGRNIMENVLLTQEIVTDIRKRGKTANVVIKLDMAKAYDRVSWLYLCKVMGKMGFSSFFIDLIWRLLANNWYSVLLNGQAHGFFHSTRGVKQRDPLSPALFIIAAEDDTIIFSSVDNQSLQMIMNTLQEYEKVSGQLINKSKSSFYMFSKVSHELSQQVATVIGFVRGQFPFTYLGVPITHARKRKVDYTELLKKVKDSLQTWKGKLLSYRGKAVLITSVLQSIPIHVLSAIRPPKCVTKELHRIFARFFWNTKEEGRCRHWAAWLNMCIPKHERGLGFRSIHDISKALCAKLWWKFRTTSSLWANFVWNKYCKKQIPQVVQWKGGSQVWKIMLEARESIEQEIWWEPNIGSSNIWFDNWTKLGALSYVVPQSWQINEHAEDVSELMTDGGWNVNKLMQLFPEDIVQHILQEIDIKHASNE